MNNLTRTKEVDDDENSKNSEELLKMEELIASPTKVTGLERTEANHHVEVEEDGELEFDLDERGEEKSGGGRVEELSNTQGSQIRNFEHGEDNRSDNNNNNNNEEDEEDEENPLVNRRRSRYIKLLQMFGTEILNLFSEEEQANNEYNYVDEDGNYSKKNSHSYSSFSPIRIGNRVISLSYDNLMSFLLIVLPALIFLLVFFHSFYLEVCLFTYLWLVVVVINSQMVSILRGRTFPFLKMFVIFIFAIGNILLLFLVIYPTQRLFFYFGFTVSSGTLSFFNYVWLSVIIDFIGKIGTLVIKSIAITILFFMKKCVSPFKKGSILSVIEMASFLYRNIVPTVTIWVPYFLNSEEYHRIMSFLFIGVLFVCKFTHLVLQIREVRILFLIFFCRLSELGTVLKNPRSLVSTTCPICNDSYNQPIRLKCTHVFCKQCISQYCKEKNEKNCYICGKSIKVASTVSSNGSTNLIPIIF